jgi:hypothetical protein
MAHASGLVWLLKAALTSLIAVFLCAAITPIIADPNVEASEQDGQGAPALIDYRSKPIPNAVLLGTSLTFRLKEELFLPIKLRNLSIPGRSLLNGLRIIASYPSIPANIFIETNVMVWNSDEEFTEKFSYRPRPFFHIAPPIKSMLSKRPHLAKPSDVDETILQKPPADYDNSVYVERGKAAWNVHAHDLTITSNVDALAQLIQEVEARGSRVYLFELPLAPGMSDTIVAQKTRATFLERFGDPSRWLSLNYPVDQLRFRDDAHLDERSALIVARSMRDTIKSMGAY